VAVTSGNQGERPGRRLPAPSPARAQARPAPKPRAPTRPRTTTSGIRGPIAAITGPRIHPASPRQLLPYIGPPGAGNTRALRLMGGQPIITPPPQERRSRQIEAVRDAERQARSVVAATGAQTPADARYVLSAPPLEQQRLAGLRTMYAQATRIARGNPHVFASLGMSPSQIQAIAANPNGYVQSQMRGEFDRAHQVKRRIVTQAKEANAFLSRTGGILSGGKVPTTQQLIRQEVARLGQPQSNAFTEIAKVANAPFSAAGNLISGHYLDALKNLALRGRQTSIGQGLGERIGGPFKTPFAQTLVDVGGPILLGPEFAGLGAERGLAAARSIESAGNVGRLGRLPAALTASGKIARAGVAAEEAGLPFLGEEAVGRLAAMKARAAEAATRAAPIGVKVKAPVIVRPLISAATRGAREGAVEVPLLGGRAARAIRGNEYLQGIKQTVQRSLQSRFVGPAKDIAAAEEAIAHWRVGREHELRAQVDRMLGDLTPEEDVLAQRVAAGTATTTDPRIRAFADFGRRLLDRLHPEAQPAGVKYGVKPNYMPVIFTDEARAQRAEEAAALGRRNPNPSKGTGPTMKSKYANPDEAIALTKNPDRIEQRLSAILLRRGSDHFAQLHEAAIRRIAAERGLTKVATGPVPKDVPLSVQRLRQDFARADTDYQMAKRALQTRRQESSRRAIMRSAFGQGRRLGRAEVRLAMAPKIRQFRSPGPSLSGEPGVFSVPIEQRGISAAQARAYHSQALAKGGLYKIRTGLLDPAEERLLERDLAAARKTRSQIKSELSRAEGVLRPHNIPEGWVQLGGPKYLPGKIKKTWVPPEVAQTLHLVSPSIHEPGRLAQFLETLNRWWKKSRLASPAYDARNLQNDLFRALQEYVSPVSGGQIALQRAAPASLTKMLGKTGLTQREAQFIMNRVGVRSGQVRGELRPGGVVGNQKGPFRLYSEKIRQPREDLFRVGTFVSQLKRGRSPLEAGARTRQVYYDYANPGTAVEAARRGVYPFGTWLARNLPAQVRNALQRPGTIAAYANAQQGLLNAAGNPSFANVPPWVQQMLPLAIGGGFRTDQVPLADVAGYLPAPGGAGDVAANYLGGLGPPYQAVAAAMGRNLGTMSDIQARTAATPLSDLAASVVEGLSGGRANLHSGLATTYDPATGQPTDHPAVAGWFSWLVNMLSPQTFVNFAGSSTAAGGSLSPTSILKNVGGVSTTPFLKYRDQLGGEIARAVKAQKDAHTTFQQQAQKASRKHIFGKDRTAFLAPFMRDMREADARVAALQRYAARYPKSQPPRKP
jgi:hypothetical protein